MSTLKALVVTAIAIFMTLSAQADKHYILVDNSGSMASEERRSLVVDILSFELEKLGDDTDVSLTFFQGPPLSEVRAGSQACEVPVDLKPFEKVSSVKALDSLPSASGSTPIVSAIRAIGAAPSNVGAEFLLITDGESTCSDQIDICNSVRSLFRSDQELNLRVRFIDPKPQTLDALSCITTAQHVPSFEFHYSPPEVERADFLAAQTYGALIAFMIIALSVRLNWWSRTTKAILDVDEEADDDKTAGDALEDDERLKALEWIAIIAAALFALWAGCAIANNLPKMPKANNSMLVFSNSAFGSRLIPTAILGLVGWFMIQLWEIANIRREKKWRVKQQAQHRQIARRLRAAEERARLDDLRQLRQAQDKLRDDQRDFWLSSGVEADAELKELRKKAIDKVYTARGTIIQKIEDHSIIKDDLDTEKPDDATIEGTPAETVSTSAYSDLFKWGAEKLAKKLKSDNLITTADEYRDLVLFFSAWSNLCNQRNPDAESLSKILEFEPFTLRFLPVPETASD